MKKFWKTDNELQKIILEIDNENKEKQEKIDETDPHKILYKWKIKLVNKEYWAAKEHFFQALKYEFDWKSQSEMLLHLTKMLLKETNEVIQFPDLPKTDLAFYYVEVSKILSDRWDIKSAEIYADKALETWSWSVEARINKLRLLFKQEKFDETIKMMWELNKEIPYNMDFLELKAEFLLKMRKIDLAEETINLILEKSPKSNKWLKFKEDLAIMKASR